MNAPGGTPLPDPPGYGRLARFFWPLALQAASQSLCYPLVAMVAARGPGGTLDLAGLAQANTVLFFLGMFAISLVPTGMVFARSREGYRQFYRVALGAGACASGLQALICLEPLSALVFERLIGLPPAIAAPARTSLLAGIPLQLLFFSRIPYFVAMYSFQASGLASLATIGRVALTAALTPVFCLAGWVGPAWAVAALTLPVALEALVSRAMAQPFLARQPALGAPPPRLREIFEFSLPLTFGGYFLTLAAVAVAAILARAPEPERMLPVYYLALGLASPVAFSATRIQTLVLAFPPVEVNRGRTLRFAWAAGALLGLLPLVFLLPGLDRFYYVTLQNLDPADLPWVRRTAALFVFFPLAVALRARGEGLAAALNRPRVVLFGHALLLCAASATGALALSLAVPGSLIGALSLTAGSFASSATMHAALRRARRPDPQPRGVTPPT